MLRTKKSKLQDNVMKAFALGGSSLALATSCKGDSKQGTALKAPSIVSAQCTTDNPSLTGTFSGLCNGLNGDNMILQCIGITTASSSNQVVQGSSVCTNGSWNVTIPNIPSFATNAACLVIDSEHGLVSPFLEVLCVE